MAALGWKEAADRAGEHVGRLSRREKDLALLGRIDDNDHELTAGEANAFREMRDYIAAGEHRTLSLKQREWAETVELRVSEGEYDNAYSDGRVPDGAKLATPGRVHHFETMARPLKPPGRK